MKYPITDPVYIQEYLNILNALKELDPSIEFKNKVDQEETLLTEMMRVATR